MAPTPSFRATMTRRKRQANMLRVRTPLDALGRRCCASKEKTEVLLDGSVARLQHRQLQGCRIDREDRGALGRLCCKIVASTEKNLVVVSTEKTTSQRRRQRLNGEDNWSIPRCMSQTWRGGFNDHQLLPIHCIPSWCLRNKPPNNTDSHGY